MDAYQRSAFQISRHNPRQYGGSVTQLEQYNAEILLWIPMVRKLRFEQAAVYLLYRSIFYIIGNFENFL